MTDFTALLQPDRGQPAVALHRVEAAGLEAWLAAQPPRIRAAIAAQRFAAKDGTMAILPGEEPAAWSVAFAPGDEPAWALAAAAARLPEGSYRLADGEPGEGALGWLLAQHRFDRYRKAAPAQVGPRLLLTREPATIGPAVALAGRWLWCATSSTPRPATSARPNSPMRWSRSRAPTVRASRSPPATRSPRPIR